LASINKISVRNEVSRLKADFEQLCYEGKVTTETKVLMSSMLMVIELMLSIFLERTTKKDSTNSSKPSSQTEKDDSSLGHQGSHGKGKGENKRMANNSRVIETVTLAEVERCDVCGEICMAPPMFAMKDGQRLILCLRKPLNMWMQRLNTARAVMRRSKAGSLRICTARYSMATD